MKKELQNLKEQIENLLPWDKEELINSLLTYNDVEDRAREYGIIDDGELDPIATVIDNCQEQEMLQSIDDMDILAYVEDNIEPEQMTDYFDDSYQKELYLAIEKRHEDDDTWLLTN